MDMYNLSITDSLFREAVDAVDKGNIEVLKNLLASHPRLVHDHIDAPEEGYFRNPYLLYFVADNPIRHEKLPDNIVAITNEIIQAVTREKVSSLQQQLDYTLGLVATGRIPRECGVQIQMMDLLIDAGATPGGGVGAIAHGNIDAARHLIKRGGKLTLAVAICIEQSINDIKRLAEQASVAERQVALTAAAFYDKSDVLTLLLGMGVDINAFPAGSGGFHSHATALHQAVYSGSLESVKVLVDAGANMDIEDRIYGGTPLGWAMHMQTEECDESMKRKYKKIEEWLKNV